jgi:hypothetical protein
VAVLAVVLIVGGGLTPWDTLAFLIEEGGVGDRGASVIAFVAGYTLPLTAGIGLIAFLILSNRWPVTGTPAHLLLVAAILGGAGLVASSLGLGLLPDFTASIPQTGAWFMRPLGYVLNAYFNTYGWPLMICAAAIGIGAALHIERVVDQPPTT